MGALAVFLALLVGDVLRIRRAHVEHAMQRARIADPGVTARAMYRSLARGLVELVRMALSPARPLPVAIPGDQIRALVSRGRGAVIATAHTGNWDLAACAVASEAPLTVVTKRLHVGLLDRLWQGARRARGVRLVQAGGAARVIAGALRRGELVAMLVDQAPERSRGAIRVPFLGEAAWVDLAPALCAQRGRAPLVVAFPRRDADGTHSVEIAAVLEPPDRPSRAWAIAAMTHTTELLEAFVRRHPEQWLWMHRRWKDQGAPASRAASSPRLAGVSP